MPKTWFVTASRTAVDWDTDLVDRVAQVDLFHIERSSDDSWELMFLFARAGQEVLAQKITWAQGVESADPVPDPLVPPSTGGGGSSGGGTSGGVGVAVPSFTADHAAGVGTLRWYNDTDSAITLAGVRVSLSAAASGAATVVDVNVDGTSALDSPVEVAAGEITSGKIADEITVPAGSYVTVDVDSVGSPGADETVHIQFYQ